ncbi:MAG TPA: hypothetical protein VFS20_06375 [Longimicrobium sp.]|nr:hypothetical protein [Longimicrobium sp.]
MGDLVAWRRVIRDRTAARMGLLELRAVERPRIEPLSTTERDRGAVLHLKGGSFQSGESKTADFPANVVALVNKNRQIVAQYTYDDFGRPAPQCKPLFDAVGWTTK